MAFYLPLPQVCVQLEKHFIIDGVHTDSSLRHKHTSQDVKKKYKQNIKDGSNNFSPDPEKKYIVCVRMTCCAGRNGGLPHACNVAKPIMKELFPANRLIDIVKGIQAEGEIIGTGNEQTEIYIYSVI
jgi:hypothetical protein